MKNCLCFFLLAILLCACSSFSTNVWRTEQTALNTAYAAYVGYTNGLERGLIKVSPQQEIDIKRARLSFAGSLGVLEAWRAAYLTNSTLKPQLQAALDAALDQSSNVLYLINFVKGQP